MEPYHVIWSAAKPVAWSGIFHEFEHGAVSKNENNSQRFGGVERAEKDFRALEFRLETFDSKRDVRQVSHWSMYGTVALEAEKLDSVGMPRWIGHPHLCRFDIHFAGLFVCSGNADVIKCAHILRKT